MCIVLLLIMSTFQLTSSEIINPYLNKNNKYEDSGGQWSENTFYPSQETYSDEILTQSEERRQQKLGKMKELLGLLKDLKDRQFRKRNMRLSDQVADNEMIQDRPEIGPFYRVLIPHPPRPKRLLLKRGKRRRRRKRIRRKLGLRLHNNFNFRRIRKAYKEKLFTRIFVCFFNLFC